MNIQAISKRLEYFSSGYPFLVSKLCKIIHEEIMEDSAWLPEMVDAAVQRVLMEKNTNFESLIKNLENNPELHDLVHDLIVGGAEKAFNINNPVIDQGVVYGVFKNGGGKVIINNRIYELLIYDYLTSKIETLVSTEHFNFKDHFITADNRLDVSAILLKFQEFMRHEYSRRDKDFLERNGRLIFLAFMKPIISGYGFDFKEVQISEEKRLDVVVTWLNEKHVVELKIWRGEAAHRKGLVQLGDYLDRLSLNKGFLIIFDLRSPGNKEWKSELVDKDGKKIFIVHV